MNVPFLDLKAQYKEIENEVLPIVSEAMENGMFIGGPNVDGFEQEFADFCSTQYCIGVNSGTDALRFAIMAAGISAGDEVITVPNTFIATTEAITQAGATPVFIDIDPYTCNMDPNKLNDFLEHKCSFEPSTDHLINRSTRRPVKAVIPVHLYGQVADMDPILEIARKRRLLVIEDACQAHGALYKGNKAGSLATAGCFSFYPGKNLGAYGEGGALVTDDKGIADQAKMIRDHGQSRKYYHDIEGYNGRLDAIQAGVLRIKLKRLANWNKARRDNAALYDELLSGVAGVSTVKVAQFAESVYHLYVVIVDRRDALQSFLSDKGIATGLHYPLPLHLQKAYSHLGYGKGDFPATERIAERLLSLPMYPELSRAQIKYITDAVKEFSVNS